MIKWDISGLIEDHLTIYPCYIGNVEKGENDTHSCMNAALNWGVNLLAFSISIIIKGFEADKMEQVLEKWECLNDDCNSSFLVDRLSAVDKVLTCPFCKGECEAVAHSSPITDLVIMDQLNGCLYPY